MNALLVFKWKKYKIDNIKENEGTDEGDVFLGKNKYIFNIIFLVLFI